jgi:hypothetical protein
MAHRNAENNESVSVPFGLGTIAIFNGSLANAMNHNRTLFEQGVRAWHEEALRFINRRLEENAHAIESCQECDNLADLLALQQKWVAQAALDLFDESMRMGETMQKLVTEKTEETNGAGLSELRKVKRRAADHQEAA